MLALAGSIDSTTEWPVAYVSDEFTLGEDVNGEPGAARVVLYTLSRAEHYAYF